MKIGIFVAVAGREESGPETYEISIVRALASIDQSNEYHIYCYTQKARDVIGVQQSNFHFHILWPDFRPLATMISLPLLMLKHKIDFLHATFIPSPLYVKPYVFNMHGTDMFEHPEFFSKSVIKRLVALIKIGLKQANKTICVSQHVKNFLVENFRYPADKLEVVYHGVSPEFQPLDQTKTTKLLKKEYSINRPYFLYVGKLVAGKNIDRLLQAFLKFKRKHIDNDVALVLAGKSYPGMTDIEKTLEDPDLKPHIYRLGQVQHNMLPPIFSQARMFIFPTLCEGFGLPIIEAMSSGTPVVTSDIPSLREITDGNAAFFDPESVDEMVEAMEKVYLDQKTSTLLSEKGLKRAEYFTWENSARQTLAVYEDVYNQVKKKSSL